MTSQLEKEIKTSDASEHKDSSKKSDNILDSLSYRCETYHGASKFYRKMIRNSLYRRK